MAVSLARSRLFQSHRGDEANALPEREQQQLPSLPLRPGQADLAQQSRQAPLGRVQMIDHVHLRADASRLCGYVGRDEILDRLAGAGGDGLEQAHRGLRLAVLDQMDRGSGNQAFTQSSHAQAGALPGEADSRWDDGDARRWHERYLSLVHVRRWKRQTTVSVSESEAA